MKINHLIMYNIQRQDRRTALSKDFYYFIIRLNQFSLVCIYILQEVVVAPALTDISRRYDQISSTSNDDENNRHDCYYSSKT